MPPPGYQAPPGPYGQMGRQVPPTLDAVYYKSGLNILLYIVTCTVWGAVWAYKTHDDLEKYNREGLGGTVGLILGLLVQVAIMFTVPSEIEKMYQREGLQSPVKTIDGLWFLLPVIGQFVWYSKVQNALNDFWVSRGSQPAAA